MFNVQIYDLISKGLKKNNSGVRLNWKEIVDRGWLNESSEELLRRFSTYFNRKDYAALEARALEFSALQDKTIKTVLHKWHKGIHTEEERIKAGYLFNSLANEFAKQLGVEPNKIFKKYTEWQSGNLFENIRRSKLPWVSTGVYTGKPEQAKLI
jgi:hypothetical protein